MKNSEGKFQSKMGYAPSSVNFVDSFPPRGSLDERKGFPFFRIFALSKNEKGEASERGFPFFAEFCFEQNEAKKGKAISKADI